MNGGRFLVVEDEFVVAENLRTCLESMGYEVVGLVASGEEAMELAGQGNTDVALMDIQLLGGMDGIETAIRLRQELDVPVLFLTAFADESLLERAKLAEPLGYLVKPFERKAFRASVEMAHYKATMDRLLKESEKRYRTLFEAAQDGMAVADIETGIMVSCNQALCRMIERNMEEIVGQPQSFLHPPQDLIDGQSPSYREHRRDPAGAILEDRLVSRSGRIIPVEIRGTDLQINGRGHILGVFRDITERKQMEQALWKQYELQRTLLSAIPAYVYIKDLGSVYMVGNRRLSELSGVPEGEIPGKTDHDFFPESVANSFRSDDAKVIAAGTAKLNYEMEGKDAEGNSIWFSTSKSPFHGPSGEIAGLVGICVDITERKRAEEERQRFERRLQQVQKAESLGRMAGAIAHHFNNQLGTAMGNLELAMMDLPKGARPHVNITEALKACQRAAEVSSLMLTYLGQTPGISELLDLSEVCRRGLALLQVTMPQNVTLVTDLPSFGPGITANPSHIQQVLTNLLTNAWEAVGEGSGAIHLTVKTVSSADIPASHRPISWQPDDSPYACMEVEDTGCGIADKDIEKIFDPFFSTKFTGRGLGLPVVLGILKAHRGVVTVESEPGRGSVFRVFFPVSAEKVPRLPPKAAQAPGMDEGGTVLLVDDEPALRRMVTVMLTRLGFTVLEAEDGVGAVEVFQQHQDEIRCVLCDLTMPRKNGWETIEALRAFRPDIAVVLASGYDEARVLEGKGAELPQAFLHKPYTMAELKAALGAAMGAPSAESVKRD
jgi:PAS domain S-box-containing protein